MIALLQISSSHEHGGGLPLLSARPAVTFPARSITAENVRVKENSENRTVFDEVMCGLRWLTFLAHAVHWAEALKDIFSIIIKQITPRRRRKHFLVR